MKPRGIVAGLCLGMLVLGGLASGRLSRVPAGREGKVFNPAHLIVHAAYHVVGRAISVGEATRLLSTDGGRQPVWADGASGFSALDENAPVTHLLSEDPPGFHPEAEPAHAARR
jgi:hypothetical protein